MIEIFGMCGTFFMLGFLACAILVSNNRQKDLTLEDLPTKSEGDDE
jgi:hypothetical protein